MIKPVNVELLGQIYNPAIHMRGLELYKVARALVDYALHGDLEKINRIRDILQEQNQ